MGKKWVKYKSELCGEGHTGYCRSRLTICLVILKIQTNISERADGDTGRARGSPRGRARREGLAPRRVRCALNTN
ncbi:hypothetical protein EVAR_78381_1 [Eumeta japonica]|uniref:Uncharacterized protein n=1 Tax=Eumeta variegata TaxID=151549 RepID=A0A4C1T6H2_EUMVA|nr:hypothetical protein EVAR_78381_1 [Eumeta japonica]